MMFTTIPCPRCGRSLEVGQIDSPDQPAYLITLRLTEEAVAHLRTHGFDGGGGLPVECAA